MKNRKDIHGLLLLLLVLSSNLTFAEEPVSKSFFGSLAIGGHDTVAYHHQAVDHKATEGEKSFTVEWKGAKWRFATLADSEAFALEPERYAPAYNGFCANALSLGTGLVKTDGTHWQIYEDQLFLFYAKKGRERWLDGNYEEYKVVADREWQAILAEQEQ